MKIYLASSFHNKAVTPLADWLRKVTDYQIYDFYSENHFMFSDTDPNWKDWSLSDWLEQTKALAIKTGFKNDWQQLSTSDVCVLIMPCGRSAHLEFGYSLGAKKPGIIYYPTNKDHDETDLMHLMATAICVGRDNLKMIIDKIATDGVKTEAGKPLIESD